MTTRTDPTGENKDMASIKQQLKQSLIEKQHRQYEEDLAAQNETYDNWIRN